MADRLFYFTILQGGSFLICSFEDDKQKSYHLPESKSVNLTLCSMVKTSVCLVPTPDRFTPWERVKKFSKKDMSGQ